MRNQPQPQPQSFSLLLALVAIMKLQASGITVLMLDSKMYRGNLLYNTYLRMAEWLQS